MLYQARIAAVVQEAETVVTLQMEPLLGFTFKPGQYVMLGEPALPMAIASGMNDTHLEFSIRKSPTTAHFFELKPGDSIALRGPLGTHFDVARLEHHQQLYFIAGGTGITPIRSLVRSLKTKIPMKLFYGVRSLEDVMYRDEMEHWDVDIVLALEKNDNALYTLGFVTEALEIETLVQDSIVFICGPWLMLKAVAEVLERKGVPQENIYVSVAKIDADGKVIGPVLPVSDLFL